MGYPIFQENNTLITVTWDFPFATDDVTFTITKGDTILPAPVQPLSFRNTTGATLKWQFSCEWRYPQGVTPAGQVSVMPIDRPYDDRTGGIGTSLEYVGGGPINAHALCWVHIVFRPIEPS